MDNLIDVIRERKLVSEDKLHASLMEQKVTKESLGKILVRNNFIRQDALFLILQELDPNSLYDESIFASTIPADVLIQTKSMLVAVVQETLYLATLSSPSWVRKVIEPHTVGWHVKFTATNPLKVIEYLRQLQAANQVKQVTWERIFQEAMRTRASDIHILPRSQSYSVQYRRDGILHLEHSGSTEEFISLVTRVKDLARMDMAERRRTQDGSFTMSYNGRIVTFRVVTLPTIYGEKMVVRILDPDSINVDLSKLGITEVEAWRRAVSHSNGLCLVCGPTGSGKTTTLMATVSEMNMMERAICTVEEPVEYPLPYAAQVNVNNNVGLDFKEAIRSFMRGDPDVIMVGEVRDIETARNAIKAAETGHMTIATLHTNSVISAAGRLKHIGVEPYELRHLLRGVLVQSLIRVYCKDCKGQGTLTMGSRTTTCPFCKGSKYRGREVVSEMCYFSNEHDVDAVLEGKVTWRTMAQDARRKVLEGRTSREEFFHVFGYDMDEVADYVPPPGKQPGLPAPASGESDK